MDERTRDTPPGAQSLAAPPSLVRAWLAIGLRPTRPVILKWARLATPRWVVISLLVSLALDYAGQTITLLLDAAATAHASSTWWIEHLINALLVYPASFVPGMLATAWLVGYFSRGRQAPVTTRFWRALRPYALAQVPGEIVSLAVSPSLNMFGQMPRPTDNVFLSTGPFLHLLLACGGCGVALAALVYGLALLVNALYVGSGLNRVVCFLLAAVATVAVELAVSGIAALIGAPFGLRLWPYPWP